ncbi:MAG: hypothetical protein ACREH9_13015, partial [Pseudomonadota bacterium]
EELQARPPERIVYDNVPPEAFLRMWPSSNPRDLRLTRLENFIHSHYHVTLTHPHPRLDFEIMERNEPAAPLAHGQRSTPGS